eukprot:760907-Hanusia_phi.AAC.5
MIDTSSMQENFTKWMNETEADYAELLQTLEAETERIERAKDGVEAMHEDFTKDVDQIVQDIDQTEAMISTFLERAEDFDAVEGEDAGKSNDVMLDETPPKSFT